MDLTDGQLEALQQLDRKRRGQRVPFVKIADAQDLTALGLASRNQEGWVITAAGSARLADAGLPPPPADDPTVVAIGPEAGPVENVSDFGIDPDELFGRWSDLHDLLMEQLRAWRLTELGVDPSGAGPTTVSTDELEARITSFDRSLRSNRPARSGPKPVD